MTAETRLDGAGVGVGTSVFGDGEGDLARTERVLFVQPNAPTP